MSITLESQRKRHIATLNIGKRPSHHNENGIETALSILNSGRVCNGSKISDNCWKGLI